MMVSVAAEEPLQRATSREAGMLTTVPLARE